MVLEIACFNSASCLTAQKAGAQRIELCENYKAGGISPSEKLFLETKQNLQIKIFVMIRPRPGDFNYTDAEFELMKKQIVFFKENKCDGFVFGILTTQDKVDTVRCKELVESAKPLPCTFHRAFDEIENSESALEEIINCGFKRILTSGKQKTAAEGSDLISSLIKKTAGRIIIMPGGGVRSSNIAELYKKTSAVEFHSAAIVNSGEIADENEITNILCAL